MQKFGKKEDVFAGRASSTRAGLKKSDLVEKCTIKTKRAVQAAEERKAKRKAEKVTESAKKVAASLVSDVIASAREAALEAAREAAKIKDAKEKADALKAIEKIKDGASEAARLRKEAGKAKRAETLRKKAELKEIERKKEEERKIKEYEEERERDKIAKEKWKKYEEERKERQKQRIKEASTVIPWYDSAFHAFMYHDKEHGRALDNFLIKSKGTPLEQEIKDLVKSMGGLDFTLTGVGDRHNNKIYNELMKLYEKQK